MAIGLLLFSGLIAPGHPGLAHSWAPALKEAVGTAYEEKTAASPVWFTIAQGIVTEVFYPNADTAQLGDLQILVTDGKSYFSEQKRDTESRVVYDGFVVKINSMEKNGAYVLEQKVFTDPKRAVVLVSTQVRAARPGLKFYALMNPAMNNHGNDDRARVVGDRLVAESSGYESKWAEVRKYRSVAMALASSVGFTKASVGYVGTSDGWQELSKNFKLVNQWQQANDGNVALIGELPSVQSFDLALGFGSNTEAAINTANAALADDVRVTENEYKKGWQKYLDKLSLKTDLSKLSALIIKSHEDKEFRGAIVASLSKPSVPNRQHAPPAEGGYHAVWSRDVYHAALGLIAVGDFSTPLAVMKNYFRIQKPDGSWPQNTWVDGKAYWGSLQLDEISWPIILADKLKQMQIYSPNEDEIVQLKKAAEFIIRNGPYTPQDRWEDINGYVPSTIAAEVAALYAASRVTGDTRFNDFAEEWDRKIERWTVVKSGPFGSDYYIRTSPSGRPEDNEFLPISNGGGEVPANSVLDGGFLELVRLGLRAPGDSYISNTIALLDWTSNGLVEHSADGGIIYRRYTGDRYGHNYVGGFWPVLAGERAEYYLAAKSHDMFRKQVRLIESCTLPSGVMPEQVTSVNESGQNRFSDGVASPLVWSHAEYLKVINYFDEI